MRVLLAALLFQLTLTACTPTVLRQETTQRVDDSPSVGVEVHAGVGEYLLKKGIVTEAPVLVVTADFEGEDYHIPAGRYGYLGTAVPAGRYSVIDPQDMELRFVADGVRRKATKRVPDALVARKGANTVCVLSGRILRDDCFSVGYSIERQAVEQEAVKPLRTLIYNGRTGDTIRFGYREFSDNLARPAFSNEVIFDLAQSRVVAYGEARIEVIEANNTGITYKVLQHFDRAH